MSGLFEKDGFAGIHYTYFIFFWIILIGCFASTVFNSFPVDLSVISIFEPPMSQMSRSLVYQSTRIDILEASGLTSLSLMFVMSNARQEWSTIQSGILLLFLAFSLA